MDERERLTVPSHAALISAALTGEIAVRKENPA
jgi:hypothetical protein